MAEKTVCNRCGEPLDQFDKINDPKIHKKIGYGSQYDGATFDLHLCSVCLDEVIEMIRPICRYDPVEEKLM